MKLTTHTQQALTAPGVARKATLAGALLLGCTLAPAQTTYLQHLRVDTCAVQKQGDRVNVAIGMKFDSVDLARQHSLTLVPVIFSADGSQVLVSNLNEIYNATPNAMAVKKGFSCGVMDYEGNWLYKTTVFNSFPIAD